MKKLSLILFAFVISMAVTAQSNIWSAEKANAWYALQAWPVGCNFIPSSAINELEMWQNETFDLPTIDRELGWASDLGMNTVRVFLHYVPWQTNAAEFKHRITDYLGAAEKHRIKTLFVLFDDCWNDDPKAGKQPDPKPGVHNSGWMQCPGIRMHDDSSTWKSLTDYARDILSSFKYDQRIFGWDLYNEPGNSKYGITTLPLLKRIFETAWAVRPTQPLTCGVWYDNAELNAYQLANSDIISFHNYDKAESMEKQIKELEQRNRPVICTEYMARIRGSLFETHLPIMKKYKVGAINWGFVSGKTNTIFQWDHPVPSGQEPQLWFHDIYRRDGSAFDPKEVAFIKQITGVTAVAPAN